MTSTDNQLVLLKTKPPYNITGSWVTTRTFKLIDMLELPSRDFVLDTTLDAHTSNSDHSDETGHL